MLSFHIVIMSRCVHFGCKSYSWGYFCVNFRCILRDKFSIQVLSILSPWTNQICRVLTNFRSIEVSVLGSDYYFFRVPFA